MWQETPIRKLGYAVAIPGWNMYVGTGVYLDDIDAKLSPIAWTLGLAILGSSTNEKRPGCVQILLHRGQSLPSDGHQTFLIALSNTT